MNKKTSIILAVIGSVAIAAIMNIPSGSYPAYGNRTETVTIGNRKFRAEVVSDEGKMRQGLGGRDGLCRSCGMLFRFSRSGRYPFWMKDMLFPLDIIWISSGRVVHLEKNVPADFSGILSSPADADSVLEVNAGNADKMGIRIGDDVDFR